MPIYFLRHGQSEAQAKGLYPADGEDPPLTIIGKQQAADAIAELTKLNISEIISSPLKRALQTAEIVRDSLGLKNEVEVDNRLTESDVGILQGKPMIKLTPDHLLKIQAKEDPQQFYNRLFDFLKDNYAKHGSILIVSHSSVGRMVEAIIKGMDPRLFYNNAPYPNARPILINTQSIKFTGNP
jgi:broad specificity phosphatase PhoE